MSFEIRPERYFIGMWHYKLPPSLSKFGKGGNVCAMVWRGPDDPENQWTIQFRLRHYRDDRVFEHNDEMNWYTGKMNGSEIEVEEKTTLVYKLQASLAGETLDLYPLHCDGESTLNKFQTDPPYWLHMQQGFSA